MAEVTARDRVALLRVLIDSQCLLLADKVLLDTPPCHFEEVRAAYIRLSKAKNTSVNGLMQAGILDSARGKVRLIKSEELPADWDPATDARLTNWETVHQLIRVLTSGGESAAAELVIKLGVKAETARELAYRLYTLCERKKRAADALAYNGLVQSWPELLRLAEEGRKPEVAKQVTMFEEGT